MLRVKVISLEQGQEPFLVDGHFYILKKFGRHLEIPD